MTNPKKTSLQIFIKTIMAITTITALIYIFSSLNILTSDDTAITRMLDQMANKTLTGIKQTIKPAIERTQMLSNRGELHQSLKGNKRKRKNSQDS